MKRKEVLERNKEVCMTITNSCPHCGYGNISFKDPETLSRAYCCDCNKDIDDNYVTFCRCDV
jgi:hypothetical protein